MSFNSIEVHVFDALELTTMSIAFISSIDVCLFIFALIYNQEEGGG